MYETNNVTTVPCAHFDANDQRVPNDPCCMNISNSNSRSRNRNNMLQDHNNKHEQDKEERVGISPGSQVVNLLSSSSSTRQGMRTAVCLSFLSTMLLPSSPVSSCLRNSTCSCFIILYICILVTLSETLTTVAAATVAGGCSMEIWVYKTSSVCRASGVPDAMATLYADGVCRTNEILTVPSSNTATTGSYNKLNELLLPGTYRAICSPNRTMIRFLDTACTTSSCTASTTSQRTTSDSSAVVVTAAGSMTGRSTSSTNQTTTSSFTNLELCQQNTSIAASLYSRATEPLYAIQNVSTTKFGCSSLTSNNAGSVAFVIFGDCNDPSCPIDTTGSTDTSSTSKPTPSPSTLTPTRTFTPSAAHTHGPSQNSAVVPVAVPVQNKTNSPVSASPTRKPSSKDVSTSSPTDDLVRIETVQASMILSDVPETIASYFAMNSSETATNIVVDDWENVTTTFFYDSIRGNSTLSDAVQSVQVIKRSVPEQEDDDDNTNQVQQSENLTDEKPIISSSSVATAPPDRVRRQHRHRGLSQLVSSWCSSVEQKRMLQTNGTDLVSTTVSENSVRIMFFLKVSFFTNASMSSKITAQQLLVNTFDTESKRLSYIGKLISSESGAFAFSNLTTIQLFAKTNSTSPAPSSSPFATLSPVSNNNIDQPTPSSSSAITDNNTSDTSNSYIMPIIIASAVCGFIILSAGGYFLYQRGKKDAMKKSQLTNGKSESQTTGSSPEVATTPMTQYTNEIVCDPTNDDVSTLGGSVLFLGLTGGNIGCNRMFCSSVVADDPTATVEHDFDYSKNRFRTGAMNEDATIDDGNATRVTKATQFTSFSNLGITNISPTTLFEGGDDDENSFEQQYYNDEDTDSDKNDQKGKHHHEEGIEFEVKNDDTDPFRLVSPSEQRNKTALNFAPRRTTAATSGAENVTKSPPSGFGIPHQASNGSYNSSTAALVGTTNILATSSPVRPGSSHRRMPVSPLQLPRQHSSPQVTMFASTPPRSASSSRLIESSPQQQQYSQLSSSSPPNTPLRSSSLPSPPRLISRQNEEIPNEPLRYEIRVPPGMLGMVLDTPGGSRPVVRAVKHDSVLANTVQVGDYLVEVDSVDARPMSAIDVSNLLCIKANEFRRLVFVRDHE